MMGGEEHYDVESTTGDVENYSWAEIPRELQVCL